MSNAGSSPEHYNTNSRAQQLKGKIDKIIQDYNQAGIPRKLHKDLGDRLTLTQVANTKGVSSTRWRKARAQDVYLQVLDECSHLYIAFISVVSPTACFEADFQTTVARLLQLYKETPVRLKLGLGEKEFLKSIAVAGSFTDDLRFINLIRSLFSKETRDNVITTSKKKPVNRFLDHSSSPHGSSSTCQAFLKTSQGVVEDTESLWGESPMAISSVLWAQQGSIVSAAQLDGLQHSCQPRNRHVHGVIRDTGNSTLESQSDTLAHHQVADQRPSKRLRLGSEQIPGNLDLPGHGHYFPFSCMRRHMADNVPEPFRKGMMTSKLWGKEKDSGGLAITNSLKMYLPETPNEDALVVLRLGYSEAFNIFDLFGLGVPSEKAATEE